MAATVPPALWHVLTRLPEEFSVNDLVDLTEELQLEVFVVFHDLRKLMKADLVRTTPTGFAQSPTCRHLVDQFTS